MHCPSCMLWACLVVIGVVGLIKEASAEDLSENIQFEQILWPAYSITQEEFEAANGSTLSGWKKHWEGMETSVFSYNMGVATAALQELKSLVVEDPQERTKNWLGGRHPCDYSGVLCDQHFVVIGVDFSAMDPFNLNSMKSRQASGQFLTMKKLPNGPHWQQFGRMSLKIVRFNNVRLERPVLPDWSGFTRLQQLDLAGIGLSGKLPSSLAKLINVKRLDLRDNNFGGPLPNSWSALEHLEFLDLSVGKTSSGQRIVSFLPAVWANLRRLKVLDLSSQGIQGSLPGEWGSMPGLQVLNLAESSISGILPPSWHDMQNLTTLNLANTSVSGFLPAEWSHMQNLTMLDSRGTDVSGGFSPSWKGICRESKGEGDVPLVAYLPTRDAKLSSSPILDSSGLCRITEGISRKMKFSLLGIGTLCIIAYCYFLGKIPFVQNKKSYNKYK